MPHKLNHLLFTFAFWLMALTGFAQTFPVTISTQINQPSPIYWSNYADATTSNSPIKIQIVLNDLTISNRQVRIKCYWQGNGISFMNNDFVVGAQPLFLEGGVPLLLTNVNLAPYFEFQNIIGITPNQYAQAMPEGIYTFSVEVYDVATGQKLSRKSNVTAVIFQNEPPLLNLPLNKASIMQQNIQNIVFSWTPRQINVSNVEYQFDLVEIWDQYTPVQNAFAYSPPIYTTTTKATTLQYGVAEPQLIPGKRYAWRIKAKALVGAEEIGVFKNNGYSEIFAFSYDVYCTPPLQIATDGVSQDQAKVTWSGALDNFDYQVNYREKNADSQWYTAVTPREFVTLTNLKANTTYEYTVGAACEKGKYVHSSLQEFTTLAKDEIAFAGCGIKPDPKDLANQNPLPNLLPNDVVTAGDFPIVVIKSSGSNGRFTGEGYVTLPFLEKFRALIDAADALGGEKVNIGQFSRIRITFDNIGVNTDFKLISGEIIASYDPNWKSMIDGDKLVEDVVDFFENIFDKLFEKADKLEEQRNAGLITDQQYIKERETIWNEIKKADEEYKVLIKNNTDLPKELKDKIANLKPPLPEIASNDNNAVKQDFTTQSKEYRDEISTLKKEVDKFLSEKCDLSLKNIVTFLSTGKVNYLKLLASEVSKNTASYNASKSYSTSIYDEEQGNLKITHFKGWGTSNPVQNLFLIETKDSELNKQGVNFFWLTYSPNSVDGFESNIGVTIYFNDKEPKENEPKHCSQETTLPKGITAGAAFAETLGQAVFYGSLGIVGTEITAGIKATQCVSGLTLDAGLQMGINAIIKKYKNENFNISILVDEISWPNATVSCATAALLNNCDTKCAGLSAAIAGMADNLYSQIKSGKKISELDFKEATITAIIQGIIGASSQGIITFGINKFKAKYGEKIIKEAFEDLQAHPEKYIDDGVKVTNGVSLFKVGDNLVRIAIKQIKQGTNGKYAVIGRSMGNAEITGVRNVYTELKNIQKLEVEIFDASSLTGLWKTKFDEALAEFAKKTNNWTTKLSNQELLQLKMYKLNKEWAQHLVDEGYTILDMGDFNNLGFSAFYSMEKATIFK